MQCVQFKIDLYLIKVNFTLLSKHNLKVKLNFKHKVNAHWPTRGFKLMINV